LAILSLANDSPRVANPDHPESALNSIPKPVLQRARGLAVFQVIKAGFVFSGKAGSGLVVARLPDGSWSAPSCIATGGVGWGLQIGADITDFVIVLNTEDAIRAFSVGGNVTIGGSISTAAGPIGTGGSVQATLAHPAPMFSYSKSKGALGVIWWLLLARLCSAYTHRLVCRAFARGHGAYRAQGCKP
jgi:lipid-binding SYLF domain-containing protein